MDAALALYRKRNPRSRATSRWSRSNSTGTVTRAHCVACGHFIASCSAKYKPTKTYEREIEQHLASCQAWCDLETDVTFGDLRQLAEDAEELFGGPGK